MSKVEQRIKEIIRENASDEYGPDAFPDGVNTEAVAKKVDTEFIVIARDELPKVTQARDSDTYFVDGTNVVFTSTENAREWCLRDIAVWQYIESTRAAKVKRRDEVARFIGEATYGSAAKPTPYVELSASMQVAIDRIIELEAKS